MDIWTVVEGMAVFYFIMKIARGTGLVLGAIAETKAPNKGSEK